MQAVILAGERGAPLYPLTARQPRAMLPLAGTPLVQHQLSLLKRHNIREAILCLQVMPESFEERFEDGKSLGMILRYHRELVPLGTAGAVRSVADRIIGDSVLVLNGHVLTDADLTRLIEIHQERDAAVTLLLARAPENPSRFGVVTTDRDGRITSFSEKPAAEETAADTVNAGVYVLRRDIWRRTPRDTEYSFERQLFPQLLAEGVPMYGVLNEGRYWLAVSTLPDYQRGIADILERKIDATIDGVLIREGVWAGEEAAIHPTADVRGRVFINHHTEIGRDARILGTCSIGSRCRIDEGALVEDSIIWRGTVIEPGAVVRGSILGDNCVVRAGAVVQPGTVVGADAVIASVVAKLPTRGDIQRAGITFGTDGWQGIIADDFTVDNVRLVTQALCDWVKIGTVAGRGIVIGYDRRAQSEVFAQAAAGVVRANDLPVLLADRECPSPLVSFACRYYSAAAGIMITASDSPPQFNGFKLKAHYGGPPTSEMTAQIEDQLRQLLRSGAAPRYNRGEQIKTTDLAAPYRAHCARFVEQERLRASGLKVVVDAMYGSGAGYLSQILQDAGVEVSEIRSERNPVFGGITPDPTEENLGDLFETVRSQGADLGIALDGDADRLGACDSQGNYVDPHHIFAVVLRHLKEVRGWSGGVVRTVGASHMADKLSAHYGLPLTETITGFRHISEQMLRQDVLIGCEESGGIGVKNHLPERDGVLIGLLLLEAMAWSGKRLEDLVNETTALVGPHYYARGTIRPPRADMHPVISALQSFREAEFAGAPLAMILRRDGTRLDFEDGSWLLLRPSGTEPVVRLSAEAATPERAQELVEAGITLIQSV